MTLYVRYYCDEDQEEWIYWPSAHWPPILLRAGNDMHNGEHPEEMQMATAKRLRKLDGFSGEAYLWETDGGSLPRYVVTSATVAKSLRMLDGFSFCIEPEIYIFASDENGEVNDWMELDGSYRGGLSHTKAIEQAGYEVIE